MFLSRLCCEKRKRNEANLSERKAKTGESLSQFNIQLCSDARKVVVDLDDFITGKLPMLFHPIVMPTEFCFYGFQTGFDIYFRCVNIAPFFQRVKTLIALVLALVLLVEHITNRRTRNPHDQHTQSADHPDSNLNLRSLFLTHL